MAFQVLSSNGPGYETTVSPVAANPICTFILGHFAEDDGEHYVCLTDEHNLNELDNEVECLEDVDYSAPCNGVTLSENGETPANRIEVFQEKENFGDDNQAFPGRQNTGDDGQVSVGEQTSGDCDKAYQNGPSDLASSTGPYLIPDILEEIVRQTLRLYPYMRSSLRAVSRFFWRYSRPRTTSASVHLRTKRRYRHSKR